MTKEELENGCGMRESVGSPICKKGQLCNECECKLEGFRKGKAERQEELIEYNKAQANKIVRLENEIKEIKFKTIKEVEKIIDEIDINFSDLFFGEKCENCNKSIEPSINHYIDQLYKELKQRLKDLK